MVLPTPHLECLLLLKKLRAPVRQIEQMHWSRRARLPCLMAKTSNNAALPDPRYALPLLQTLVSVSTIGTRDELSEQQLIDAVKQVGCCRTK